MKTHIYVFCVLLLWMQFPVSGYSGSSADDGRREELVAKADSLRKEYRFQEALQLYRSVAGSILGHQEDSTALSPEDSLLLEKIQSRRIMAENGLSMKQYVSEPVVVARHVFSAEDFYLFYPMPDRSWRPVPNPLDSIPGHRFVNATYVPEGSTDIYFSAEDGTGVRNLYHTHLEDSLWTVPVLLDEGLTSSGDEIFPVVSPDGKYTIFASNRDCPQDSVTIYVLEYDIMPVRRYVEDPEQLGRIASLVPVDDPSRMDTGSATHGSIRENEDMGRYMAKMNEVRSLRDSVAIYTQALEEKRQLLSQSADRQEQERLYSEIISGETRLPVLQDSLAKATGRLQQIEMEFLFNGVVIDPDKVLEQADREVVGAATNYAFSKHSPGDSLVLRIKKPEVRFDYSFMVLPEGPFALDNTIPDGIVYQIQMFLLSKPATVSQLKGLSPVFTEETATGKYIYRVGLFRKYNDVLSNLNTVKKLGFKTAFIVAFKDGKQYPVQKARALESSMDEKKEENHYQVRIVSSGESLPDLTIKAIRQMTDRDIAKIAENGKTVFLVGPLGSESEAEKLQAMIKISGIDETSIVKLD